MKPLQEKQLKSAQRRHRGLREQCRNSQGATTRSLRHAQSAETVARAMSKFTLRHNESVERASRNALGISQGKFYARIYSRMPRPRRSTLILTPALNTYRKNPSVWTHCLGKNISQHKCYFQNHKCVYRYNIFIHEYIHILVPCKYIYIRNIFIS